MSTALSDLSDSIGGLTKRTFINIVRHGQVPRHIAFIMDGNRRYARKLNVDIREGHYEGFRKLEQVLEWCLDLGVQVISIYAFSIENFKRPQNEVDALMELARDKFTMLAEKCKLIQDHNVSIRIIGQLDLLPKEVREAGDRAMKFTAHHTKAILNICCPYTSRDEMTTAVGRTIQAVNAGILAPHDIDQDLIERCLFTGQCPEVDIMVRTSGEVRFSDYLLWQSVEDCQLHFIDTLWPELSVWQLLPIVVKFQLKYAEIERSRQQRRNKLQQQRRQVAKQHIREQCPPFQIDRKYNIDPVEEEQMIEQWLKDQQARIQQFLSTFEAHQVWNAHAPATPPPE